MAKIPQLQRLLAENFPNQAWIEPLIRNLNQFMDEVISGLNKELTIEDNMAAMIKVVEVDGVYPLKLAWNLTRRPISTVVGNVELSDGTPLTLTTAVQVQWSYNQAGQYQIDNVVGISPSTGTKYKLTLEIKAG